jgi:hypothetical protein
MRSPETRDRGKLVLDINIPKSALASLLTSSRPESPNVSTAFATPGFGVLECV